MSADTSVCLTSKGVAGEAKTKCEKFRLPNDVAELAVDRNRLAEFISAHELVTETNLTLEIARKHFGSDELTITIDRDPGEGREWISFDVLTSRHRSVVRQAYKAFVDEWTGKIDNEKSFLIRLVYQYN